MPSKESIRGTGAACRECRRLKVRCDREVPCGSCVRRGCAGICPDGQLSSMKSARYVLASTEELHDRIQALTFRIHALEHGLETEHRKVHILEGQNQPGRNSPLDSMGSTVDYQDNVHPLLEAHLKIIAKDPREPGTEDQTGDDTNFAGTVMDSALNQGQFFEFDSLNAILQLSELAMDHHSEINTHNANQLAFSYLPAKEEALRLIEVYFNNATVIFHPIQRNRVHDILFMAYDSPNTSLTPHDFSILFSVFAIGTHVDVTNTITNSSSQSSKWLSISQALLMAQGESTETNVTMVEALLLLAIGYFTKHGGGLKVLQLVAMGMKHALILCMEKDSEPGTWSVDEMVRRNRVFWELWTLDSVLGVEFMLPPTLIKAFVGAKPPNEVVPKNTRCFVFANWKYNLVQIAQEILTILLSNRSGANNSIPYAAIMVLDAKIRATRPAGLPQEIDEMATMHGDLDPSKDGFRMTMFNYLCQTTLLHLHKSYFAVALMKDQPPMSGKLAPSVLACYNCAVETLQGAFDILRDHPGLLIRFSFVWSNYFTAAAVLYSIAIYMPYWTNAAEALKIADTTLLGLFTIYAPECLYADKALPALKHLTALANDSINRQRTGTWVHPSRMQMQASTDLDILSSTGRLKVPNAFSSMEMDTGSSNDVIADLFGSRAGGAKNTELFGNAFSTFYGAGAGAGTNVGTSYHGVGPTFNIPGVTDDPAFNVPGGGRTLSWDDLIRGIQTSQVPAARNVNVSDGGDLPDPVTLRNAWKALLNTLQIK